MTLFPILLTLFLNGYKSTKLPVDTGYRQLNLERVKIKYNIPFTCEKTFILDSVIFYYHFRDTIISGPEGDTFKISFPSDTFKYIKKNASLFWNNIKLNKLKENVIDTIVGIECGQYLLDLKDMKDEERMYYFSPEYGILYEYSIVWGNPSSYLYLSGKLRGLELNFIFPGNSKKWRHHR